MATNFWICYQDKCGYRGTETEFRHPDPESGHECPKCKLDDAAFPWRKFRCLGCGFEEEQGKFFADKDDFGKERDYDLDPDPCDDKLEYRCLRLNNPMCDSTSYEQIDDSTEPPKQKLFELRRWDHQDGSFVFDVSLGRLHLATAMLDAKRCPLGTRLTALTSRYGFNEVEAEAKMVELSPGKFAFYGDPVLFDDPFDVKKGKGYGLVIRASHPKLEEFDSIFSFYVPRQEDWTSEQWVKHIMKSRRKKS